METDAELLRQYAHDRNEAAFTELVSRHINLVYAAACRETSGDAVEAKDVTQLVFIELARKAGTLTKHPTLAGWLYTTVRHVTGNLRRAQRRRTAREEKAHVMKESLIAPGAEPGWEEVWPVLDDALHELDERDRNVMVLRFLQGQSLQQVGAALGLSENAARMRAERALEKLRALLAKRGVTSTASGLTAALTAGAVIAAPPSLALSVATTSLASAGAMAAGGLGTAVWQALATSKMKSLAAVAIAVCLGIPFVVQQQANKSLRAGISRQQGQLADLQKENERLAEQLRAEAERSRLEREELLRLRGQVALLRQSERNEAPKTEASNTRSEFFVSAISFRGNYTFSEVELGRILQSKVGEPLDQQKISRDNFALEQLYREANHGAIFSQPSTVVDTNSGQARITFVLWETNSVAGVGVEIMYVKPMGALHIESVVPNSPADRDGLARGLYIQEIDGQATRELNMKECITLIRGPVGTKIQLRVYDSASKETRLVELTREKLVL